MKIFHVHKMMIVSNVSGEYSAVAFFYPPPDIVSVHALDVYLTNNNVVYMSEQESYHITCFYLIRKHTSNRVNSNI